MTKPTKARWAASTMKAIEISAYAVQCDRCGFESPPCPTKGHAVKAARNDWGFRRKSKRTLCGSCYQCTTPGKSR